MALQTAVRDIRGVTVVELNGRITLGEGCEIVRQTLTDLLAKHQKNILLNLNDVSYIDSAGLGELVGWYVTVKNRGGALKLLNSHKKVMDLLQITKLHTIFEVYENQNLAVLSFNPELESSAEGV